MAVAEVAFTEGLAVAAASMEDLAEEDSVAVAEADSVAGLEAADSAVDMAAGASVGGTADFAEATVVTVEAGAEGGAEAGAGADTAIPTSALALDFRGITGPDRTLATTIIPIIPTTGVTIPTARIRATRQATGHTGTTRMATARIPTIHM